MANCSVCGNKLTMFNKATDEKCNECLYTGATPNADGTIGNRDPAVEAVIVTTETYSDLPVAERLGIVTAECAYGMNVFKDFFASIRNIVGGRSKAVQDTMRDARETVLYELKQEAHNIGADAVIAVDLDYVQIGDNSFSMIMLVASGTAVKTGSA